MQRWTIPNIISTGRLISAPLLIITAITARPIWFLTLFTLALLSDFFDGLLARILHQKTALGARLDTWGDVAMCVSGICGAWLLWPEMIWKEAAFLFGMLFLMGFSGAISLIKHHRFPSYHTWSAKVATTILGLSALLLFTGISAWPFRIAVIMLALSAIEEIAITLILPQWTPNVHTFYHAVTLAKKFRTCKSALNR